jgi:hypothetical protein
MKMSNIEDDLEQIIKEKLKTAKKVNETFKGPAGRGLRNGQPETMNVYRVNKSQIDRAEAKYATKTEDEKQAVNE